MESVSEHFPPRSPGRPRSARAHRAILDAAIDLFAEQGYQAMSIEVIAARAGVGKTTVYRRWPSKEDLIVDAIDELILEVHPPDTGSLRDDLIELLVQLQGALTTSRAGAVFPRMAAEVAAGSPLGRKYLDRVVGPRLGMLEGVLRRGIERGELPQDVDVDVVRSMLIGPLITWKLIGRLQRRGARARAERIVDTVLRGTRA